MEKAEKDGKQKLSFRFVPTRRVIENSKKIEKKFRKYKNPIVASFQAIIDWNRPRNRENKNYHSVSFNPTRNRKFIKNCKKIQKIRKIQLWLLFKQKLVEKGREREKKKIIVSFRSYPMRNRKFQKNSKKFQKIIKYYYGFISSQNKGGNAEKE